jgi:hypothetical protein
LAHKCDGLFIFAFTTYKFISSPHHDPVERLQLVTNMQERSIHEGQAGIDTLYINILSEAFKGVRMDDHAVFK